MLLYGGRWIWDIPNFSLWLATASRWTFISCHTRLSIGSFLEKISSLAMLYFLGSGPDRGRSPVEWGDFLSVRTSVRTYVRPSVPPSGPFSQTDGRTDGRTDRRTYVRKISPFYRTLSPIGAAALLPKGSSRPIKSRAREPLTI